MIRKKGFWFFYVKLYGKIGANVLANVSENLAKTKFVR